MNVTIDAPAGYEYQYLASAYLILSFTQKGVLTSAVIDSLDKEDLQLIVKPEQGKNEAIEVQFKKKKAALDIELFANYWTHFNAYSDKANVLSKLIDGTADRYYLICNSRANDYAEELGILANATTLVKYEPGEPKKTALKQFADAIKLQHRKTNGKPSKRNDFVVAQADDLLNDTDLFQSVLKKTYVLEKLDDLTLKKVIAVLLSSLHIPVTKEELLLFRLVELVKQARGTDRNIIQDFNDLLQETISNLPDVATNYIKPSIEDQLLNELKSKGHLLLTGVTMCGKTQMAQSVIRRLVHDDPKIIYFPTGDVEQARLILLDPTNEPRVCYLEDPIEFQDSGNKSSTLKKIDSIVQQLSKTKGRYLVVTSPLQGSDKIALIKNNLWVDLTVTDRAFLKNVWQQIRQRCPEISDTVTRIVITALENDADNDLLQPGQLDYLGRNISLLRSATEPAVKLLANVGAQDIEQLLLQEDPNVIEAAMILSVTTTTLSGPDQEDLHYICSEHPYDPPGFVKQEVGSLSSSIGSMRPVLSYQLNSYGSLPDIPTGISAAMEKLTDLGYLRYIYKEPRFAHPIFQDGARRLLSSINPTRFQRIINFTRRAVGCLNVRVATNAVRCLDVIYDLHDKQSENQRLILSIAEDGLKSTFVNVRNLSILFLIGKYQTLDQEQQKKVLDKIIHRSFSKDTYYWQDGQAFIPDTKNIDKTGEHRYKSRQAQQKDWNAYLKNPQITSAEKAYQLLKDITRLTRYNKARISYPLRPLLNFLSFEESFIREGAAFLIGASVTDHDVPLIKEMFNESNPFVKYELVRGLFRSWPYLTPVHKAELLQYMKEAFDSPFSALSAIDLFTQFNAGHTSYTFDWREDVEDHAAPDMWFLWGELMVIFFKYLPYEIFIHKDRFLDALINAKINDQQRWNIVQAWLTWLPGHLSAASPIRIAGHLLYFVELFFKNIHPAKRLPLIKQILAIADPHFNATALRRIISFWDILSVEEKDHLATYTEQTDHLSQSIILTADNVPKRLQKAILNGAVISGKTPEELSLELTPKRLKECLTILFIDQSTNDLPHHAKDAWKKILPYLIKDPEKPGFDIAFYAMINAVIWKFGDQDLWLNPNDIFRTILERQNEQTNELAFYFLLEGLTGNPHSDCKALWRIFFETINSAERETYGDIIAENIESITSRKNEDKLPDDIFEEFIQPVIGKIWQIIKMFTGTILELGEEGKKTFAFTIVAFIKTDSLRTWKMYESCRDWARDNRSSFTDEEFKVVEDFSENFFTTERAQANAVEERNVKYFKNYSN